MRFASFDLETAKEIPEDAEDFLSYMPLGITCAAVALSGEEDVKFWRAKGSLTKEKCQIIVKDLIEYCEQGYTPVTWNGVGFDFRVLAFESGMFEECARIALHHVDMMLLVTFTKGWFLGLNTALQASGLEGKLKEVTLKDGTVITEMKGALAPKLWKQGEYNAVLTYLRDDVIQPLLYAEIIEKKLCIEWYSKTGKPQKVQFPKLYSALECFQIPEPDVSWMKNAPKREDFISWIPGYDKMKEKSIVKGADVYEYLLDLYPPFAPF